MKNILIFTSISVMCWVGNVSAEPNCGHIEREHARYIHRYVNQESTVAKLRDQVSRMEAQDTRSDDWYDTYLDLSLELHDQKNKLRRILDMKYFWRIKATRYCGVGMDYDHSKRTKKG